MFNTASYFSDLETAIAAMMIYASPFWRIGANIFYASAVIALIVCGWKIMFRSGSIEDHNYLFGTTVFQIALGFTLITFYENPDPVFGYSFTGLIIETMGSFVSILDKAVVTLAITSLDNLLTRFTSPGWSFLAQGIYYTAFIVITAAQVVTLGIVSFSKWAQAVLVLVGPLFVSLFLVPHFRRYFFGWMDSLIQWSFLAVTAYAYMLVGLNLLTAFSSRVPAQLTSDLYLTFGVQVLVYLMVYIGGFLLIPTLNASIFSGAASTSVVNILRVRSLTK